MQHLKITRDDSLFVITSAGDSALPFPLGLCVHVRSRWLTRAFLASSGTLVPFYDIPDALHYAISAQPRRIHCVDMNPCQVCVIRFLREEFKVSRMQLRGISDQGHLLELKLAAASALSYDEFWGMLSLLFEDVKR